MNTFLAHLVISVSIVFIVGLLLVGAFLAFHTVSKSGDVTTIKKKNATAKQSIAEIEDIDIGKMFKNTSQE